MPKIKVSCVICIKIHAFFFFFLSPLTPVYIVTLMVPVLYISFLLTINYSDQYILYGDKTQGVNIK